MDASERRVMVMFSRHALNPSNGESFFGFTIVFINSELLGASTFKWFRVLSSKEAKMRAVLFSVEMAMGRGFSKVPRFSDALETVKA